MHRSSSGASGSGHQSDINKSKRYVYHYTNRDGIEGIKDSRIIKPSTDTVRDAMMGKAVYLTEVAPCNTKDAILKNNYGSDPRRYKQDRADYYVKIPVESIPTIKGNHSDRHIQRTWHEDQPLDLSQIDDVVVGQNGKWEIPIEHPDCIQAAIDESHGPRQDAQPSYGGRSSYQDSWQQPTYGGYGGSYYNDMCDSDDDYY